MQVDEETLDAVCCPEILLGVLVRRLRGEREIGQGKLTSLSPTAYSRLERGECSASIATFQEIARALGMRPLKMMDLFDRSMEKFRAGMTEVLEQDDTFHTSVSILKERIRSEPNRKKGRPRATTVARMLKGWPLLTLIKGCALMSVSWVQAAHKDVCRRCYERDRLVGDSLCDLCLEVPVKKED